ncbi:MAG: ABC transporter permease subunit [Alphaproteobacteria bacterium]
MIPPVPRGVVAAIVALALDEDLGGRGDLTSLATLPADARAAFRLMSRAEGVLAGAQAADEVCDQVGGVSIDWRVRDGGKIAKGDLVGVMSGEARAVLTAERSVLNFLGRLCGVATLTRAYVDAVEGTGALASTILVFGAVVLLAYGVFRRISTAPYGRVLRAIRADEQVTQTLGKRTFRYKLMAFIYGSALAGLGGGLLVLYFGSASADFFTINVTVIVWIGMLIGGAGNDRGVLAGLAVIMGFQLLTRFLNQELPLITQDQFASLRFVFVGLLLMLIIRYRPQGLWGDAKRLGIDQ